MSTLSWENYLRLTLTRDRTFQRGLKTLWMVSVTIFHHNVSIHCTMEALAAGSAVKPLPVGRQDEYNRVCIDPAWLTWDDVDLRSSRDACCYVDSSEFVSPAPQAPIGEQDLDKTFVELTDQNITSVSPGQQPHVGWFIHGTVMSWHIQNPASSNVRGVLCPGVANPMEKGSSHGVLFARLKTSWNKSRHKAFYHIF